MIILNDNDPTMKLIEGLDPIKLRELGKNLRDQAVKEKDMNGEIAMIMWDDEADAVQLLSIALEDSDKRCMERAFFSMKDETHNLILEKCKRDSPETTLSLPPTEEDYAQALMIVSKYEEAMTEAKIKKNTSIDLNRRSGDIDCL